MTEKKPCTACRVTEIYQKEVDTGSLDGSILPLGFLHDSKYRIEVCGACGFTQWFVPERFLSLVKEKFELLK